MAQPFIIAGIAIITVCVIGYAVYQALDEEMFREERQRWGQSSQGGRQSYNGRRAEGPPSEDTGFGGIRGDQIGLLRRRRPGETEDSDSLDALPPSERRRRPRSRSSERTVVAAEEPVGGPSTIPEPPAQQQRGPLTTPQFLPTLLTSNSERDGEGSVAAPGDFQSLAGVSEGARESEVSEDGDWTDVGEMVEGEGSEV